jgi:hypothetical protein
MWFDAVVCVPLLPQADKEGRQRLVSVVKALAAEQILGMALVERTLPEDALPQLKVSQSVSQVRSTSQSHRHGQRPWLALTEWSVS